VLDLIASALAAFELIIDRNADYSALDALTMACDNAWCAGVVLGPAIAGWRDLDVGALIGTLEWTDTAPETAPCGDADPVGSLAWVVDVVTSRGHTMAAGDIVITGSVIKTRYPKGPLSCRYEIGGLSAVELNIA
jgi:2-keto-4-pentenoate hydratase